MIKMAVQNYSTTKNTIKCNKKSSFPQNKFVSLIDWTPKLIRKLLSLPWKMIFLQASACSSWFWAYPVTQEL